MGRPKKPDSEKLVNVGLYIAPQLVKELKEIGDKEDRERGYLTRAFYLRGLAAYKRDGLLVEPEGKRTTKRPGRGYRSPSHAEESGRQRKA